jgi:hypothetical protein
LGVVVPVLVAAGAEDFVAGAAVPDFVVVAPVAGGLAAGG